jgi:hypothetical protein
LGASANSARVDLEVEVWGSAATGVAGAEDLLSGDDSLAESDVELAAVAVDPAGVGVVDDGDADAT